jgi:death on curing protein
MQVFCRPQQHYAYGSPDLVELVSLYTAGLVRNHPFVDGNKRTGFALGIAFLELNSFVFQATEEKATQAVLALAAGDIDEAGYSAWLRSNAKRRRK